MTDLSQMVIDKMAEASANGNPEYGKVEAINGLTLAVVLLAQTLAEGLIDSQRNSW